MKVLSNLLFLVIAVRLNFKKLSCYQSRLWRVVVALSALRALSSEVRLRSGRIVWVFRLNPEGVECEWLNKPWRADPNAPCVLPCRRHTFRYRHPACPVAQRKTGSICEFIPGSVTGGSPHGVLFKKWDVPDARDKFATAQHDVLFDFVSLCLIISSISGYFSYCSYL